jgi:hypothetical protein
MRSHTRVRILIGAVAALSVSVLGNVSSLLVLAMGWKPRERTNRHDAAGPSGPAVFFARVRGRRCSAYL